MRAAITLGVSEIGSIAGDAIARAREGRVRAVFERSAYVELESHWICIGGEHLRRGPLNALVASPEAIGRWLATVAPDDRVHGTWPFFRVGSARLDFAYAARWHPAMPALPIERSRLARGLSRMRDVARGPVPAEGLAFLVAGAVRDDALAAAARDAASGLHAWLVEGQRRVFADEKSSPTLSRSLAPPDVLRQMIGLGPGLTPSGDDFLGGALVALHAFGKPEIARALGDWLLPLCAHATHPISFAHLCAAAQGEGGEALHACLLALADDAEAGDALAAIASFGHTSGWDALAGAITVASAICGC